MERDLHRADRMVNRAYAWRHVEGGDEGERYVAVLGIPPVNSAERAVQVRIVKDSPK